MIRLHGFPLSNYYNKVKFVMLEYGIPFEEVRVNFGQDVATLARSPLGKVPYIETETGPLCESQVIVEYLAAAFADKPIFAADPYAAAKERELLLFIELYLELVARDLYKEAFFGGKVTDYTKSRVEKLLNHHIAGFKRVAKFAPHVGGEAFSVADIAAFVHLPLVGLSTRVVYGRDFLLDAGIDWKAHNRLVGERAAAQQVTADRVAYMEAQKRAAQERSV
jgi:glutathione S-transferase